MLDRFILSVTRSIMHSRRLNIGAYHIFLSLTFPFRTIMRVIILRLIKTLDLDLIAFAIVGNSANTYEDCGECTNVRSQWEGCIQSKSIWLMFIYLFSLRRWKCLGSIQCKHLEYTAYFWKGNIRIYANLVG